MTDLKSPWRGKTFPSDPLPRQLFYLDVVPIDAGWYMFDTSLTTPNSAGTWIKLDRAVGDQGDLVRPIIDFNRRS